MITIEQLQQGLTKYVEQEILPALPEPGRFLVASGAYLAIKNKITDCGFLGALGCLKDGQIDLDELYSAVQKYYPDKVELPLDDLLPAGLSKIIFPGKSVRMEITKDNVNTLYKTLKGEEA